MHVNYNVCEEGGRDNALNPYTMMTQYDSMQPCSLECCTMQYNTIRYNMMSNLSCTGEDCSRIKTDEKYKESDIDLPHSIP